MSVQSGQNIAVTFGTRSPATGGATNADALPTGVVVKNGVDTAAAVTVANVATGRYRASFALPTLANGDGVELVVAAAVGGTTDASVVWRERCDGPAGPRVAPSFCDTFAGVAGTTLQTHTSDSAGAWIKNPITSLDLALTGAGGVSGGNSDNYLYTDNLTRTSADYSVQATFVMPDDTETVSWYVCLRQASGGNAGYVVGYDGSAGAFKCYKSLASSVAGQDFEPAAGATYTLRGSVHTSNGNAVVRLWCNGLCVLDWTDTGSPVLAANRGGVFTFNVDNGVNVTMTDYRSFNAATPYGDFLTSVSTPSRVTLDLATRPTGDGAVDLYRAVRPDFAAAPENLLAGGVVLPYDDTTRTDDTVWFYRALVRDGTGFVADATLGGLAGISGGPYATPGSLLQTPPGVRPAWAIGAVNYVPIGDSVAAGSWLPSPSTQAYPVIAAAALAALSGQQVSVSNVAVGGTDTTAWLPGSTNYVAARVAANALQAANPARLLVFSYRLGLNDAAVSGNPTGNRTKAQYKGNVKTTVDALLAAYPACRVLLQDPTYATPNASSGYQYGEAGVELVRQYRDALAELFADYLLLSPGRVAYDRSGFNYTATHRDGFTVETGARGTYGLHPGVTMAAAIGNLTARAVFNAFGSDAATLAAGSVAAVRNGLAQESTAAAVKAKTDLIASSNADSPRMVQAATDAGAAATNALTAAAAATAVQGKLPASGQKMAGVDDVQDSGGGDGTGDGDVPVDHDHGGTDALRVLLNNDPAKPVDGAKIRAYPAEAYAAGGRVPDGETYTGSTGRWAAPLMLDPGPYVLIITKPQVMATLTAEITVADAP